MFFRTYISISNCKTTEFLAKKAYMILQSIDYISIDYFITICMQYCVLDTIRILNLNKTSIPQIGRIFHAIVYLVIQLCLCYTSAKRLTHNLVQNTRLCVINYSYLTSNFKYSRTKAIHFL